MWFKPEKCHKAEGAAKQAKEGLKETRAINQEVRAKLAELEAALRIEAMLEELKSK